MSIDIKIWGNNIWFLFHGLLHKLKDEHFSMWKDDYIFIFKSICSNLPCPECSLDATNIIKKTNFNTVQESGTAEIEGTPLHTLNNKELKNYPGANITAEYDRQKDGGKKWQSLVKNLQDN